MIYKEVNQHQDHKLIRKAQVMKKNSVNRKDLPDKANQMKTKIVLKQINLKKGMERKRKGFQKNKSYLKIIYLKF